MAQTKLKDNRIQNLNDQTAVKLTFDSIWPHRAPIKVIRNHQSRPLSPPSWLLQGLSLWIFHLLATASDEKRHALPRYRSGLLPHLRPFGASPASKPLSCGGWFSYSVSYLKYETHPPVPVPPIKSKRSHGFGRQTRSGWPFFFRFAFFWTITLCMRSLRMSSAESPRIPPPSVQIHPSATPSTRVCWLILYLMQAVSKVILHWRMSSLEEV